MAKDFPGWFKFYWADWLLDDFVRSLTIYERGAYMELLIHQFRYGSIGTAVRTASRTAIAILGGGKWAKRAWEKLEERFPPGEGGLPQNPKMAEVRRRALEIWEQKKAAGEQSAKARRSSGKIQRPLQRPLNRFKISERTSTRRSPLLPSSGLVQERARAREARGPGKRGKKGKRGPLASGLLNTEGKEPRRRALDVARKALNSPAAASSHYGRTLVVRNALDAFSGEIEGLSDEAAIFWARVKAGRARLEEFGGRYHDEAERVVRKWEDGGEI